MNERLKGLMLCIPGGKVEPCMHARMLMDKKGRSKEGLDSG